MTITFYKFTGLRNSFPKSLGNGTTVTGTLKNECDLLNPIIVFNGIELKEYNYCYINEFNKYYFIENFSIITNELLEISLHIDVLQTYSQQLLNCYCVVSRSSSDYNEMLVDTVLPIINDGVEKIVADVNVPFNLPSNVGALQYIVCTSGMGETNEGENI